MQALYGELQLDVMQNRQLLFKVPFARDALRDQHNAIAEKILAKEPEQAREAAKRHLSYLSDAMLEVATSRPNASPAAAR